MLCRELHSAYEESASMRALGREGIEPALHRRPDPAILILNVTGRAVGRQPQLVPAQLSVTALVMPHAAGYWRFLPHMHKSHIVVDWVTM